MFVLMKEEKETVELTQFTLTMTFRGYLRVYFLYTHVLFFLIVLSHAYISVFLKHIIRQICCLQAS
jgi:hypothetical protein